MTEINVFFAMGGYAAYVWPAVIVTALVMVTLAVASRQRLHGREAELEALQRAQGDNMDGSESRNDA